MRRYDESHGRSNAFDWSDSGWVGAAPDDDLEARLAAETEPYDERRPHVLTALGPIAPDALGVTLVGGWNRPLAAPDDDPGAILRQLEQLYATGVCAVVALGLRGAHQGLADLAWVSARSPVDIITGRDLGAAPATTEPEAIRFGVTKIGSMIDVGRIAQAAPGVPVFVNGHCLASGVGGSLISRLDPAIGRSEVTVVAGAASSIGDWAPMLDAGARVAVIVPAADDAERLAAGAAAIRKLMAQGGGDRVLLGYQDDPVSLMERLPIALMEAGLAAVEVRRLLVDNPARALTVKPDGQRLVDFPTE